jgi:predicted house-cleaning NTP pyrophosphatase (Maf/HAM1 superfamily)
MIDMKKGLTIVKDWGTLVAFCTMIVIGMRILDKQKETAEGVKALQEFQTKQIEINSKESIVYNWALQKLYGTEIHGLEVEDEDPQ